MTSEDSGHGDKLCELRRSRVKLEATGSVRSRHFTCITIDRHRTVHASLFAAVEMAPRDPILGLNEAVQRRHRTRTRSTSASASTTTTTASCRCSQCVQKPRSADDGSADARAATCRSTASPPTTRPCKSLVFGADSAAVKAGRVATVQALGGTGGLKIGADFLKRCNPDAKVLISDPSWENHRALFEAAPASRSRTTPTTTPPTRGVDFDGMLAALNAAPAGTIVVLHACCHNPTGYDITPAQWDQVIDVGQARASWCPSSTWPTRASATASTKTARWSRQFVDAGARLLRRRPRSRRASRCTASASARCQRRLREQGRSRARAVQLKRVIRTNYSNPPTHGGAGGGRRCWPRRRCARCGKRSWPACACASRQMRAALVDKLQGRRRRSRT